MQPLSKNQILRGFNRREDQARTAVTELYQDALLILSRRMTGNSSSAEDHVQDSFLALFSYAGEFTELSDLRDYLFRACRNRCIDHLRQQDLIQKKHAELREQLSNTDEDFYADITYSETRALLFKSIENLPSKLQVVFRLRYFDGLLNEEVAERLAIAEKTAYNRYSEAKQKLKWDLERIKRFTIYLLNFFL